jgi:signal transduction histidine kinase
VLGQMAATVAHEIKNPLSAIKSIAQVMREDEGLSTAYARDLSLIVGETDRLNQSVTQLLSFARKPAPVEHPTTVSDLVRSVVSLFQANAEEQRIKLSASVEANGELGGAVVSAVRDSLSNLLLNALQATPAGGEVKINACTVDAQFLLSIQDTGPGVAADLRRRIWEPFFTTKQRGTGLGLAIVVKRMQEVGGSALLVTRDSGGATFELRVPLEQGKQ